MKEECSRLRTHKSNLANVQITVIFTVLFTFLFVCMAEAEDSHNQTGLVDRQESISTESDVHDTLVTCANYERINPSVYFVEFDCKAGDLPVVFKERYSSGWRMYIRSQNIRELDIKEISYSLISRKLARGNDNTSSNFSYIVKRSIRPSISHAIELPEELHIMIHPNFNGWIIDQDVIKSISIVAGKTDGFVQQIGDRYQFSAYIVYYGEIVRQVGRLANFALIALSLSAFFIVIFMRKRSR